MGGQKVLVLFLADRRDIDAEYGISASAPRTCWMSYGGMSKNRISFSSRRSLATTPSNQVGGPPAQMRSNLGIGLGKGSECDGAQCPIQPAVRSRDLIDSSRISSFPWQVTAR